MRLIVSPDEDGNWLQQGTYLALGLLLAPAVTAIVVAIILLAKLL